MVATVRQCASRSTITPTYKPLQMHQEGWGASLVEHTAMGTWSLPESKLHINYLEIKAVLLALKEIRNFCLKNITVIATDNTTVVTHIKKEGDEAGPSLCPTMENPTRCSRK